MHPIDEKEEMPKTAKPARAPAGHGADGDAAVEQWCAATLEEDPPRSKSLAATVIGDSIAPHGGEIWMASLISLLALFGFNERLVRTSVFRLADEGLLESRREGRRALYGLTERGRKRFISANRRIYMPPAQAWSGTWTLVLSPRGANSEVDRIELRRELAWLGFAAIGQGILAHPAADLPALREALEGQGLLDKVHVLQARDLADFGALSSRDIVAQCWNLQAVARSYRHFIARFEPLLALLAAREAPLPPVQGFRVRTLLIHWYRRAILHDPLFPAELLPADWPGQVAYRICRELYNLCCRPAEAHVAAALGMDPAQPEPAEPYYYLRFGGLLP